MVKYMYNPDKIREAIECVGTVREFSNKVGVAYYTAINWKNSVKTPTALSCLKIEKATGGKIKAEDILPDYPWGELERAS